MWAGEAVPSGLDGVAGLLREFAGRGLEAGDFFLKGSHKKRFVEVTPSVPAYRTSKFLASSGSCQSRLAQSCSKQDGLWLVGCSARIV